MKVPEAFKLALQIGDEFGADRAAVHYALAVSTLETENGDWPKVPAGAGSNNFGAIIQYDQAQPFFESGDTHGDGSHFVQHFRTYPTAEEGYRDFWRQLMHANVLEAASSGSGANAVAAQYGNGYFEADPASYGKHLAAVYERIQSETGEPALLDFAGVEQLKKKLRRAPTSRSGFWRPPLSPAPSSGEHSGAGGGDP